MTELDIRYARTENGGRVAFGISGQGPVAIVGSGSLVTSNFSRHPETDRWRKGLSGHTLVFYDHLGAGLSDRERYDFTLDGLVRELEAVVAALDVPDFAIVGNGATASVAVRYAVEHPDRVRVICLRRTWARGADYVQSERFAGYLEGLRGDWRLASEMYVRLVHRLSGPEAEERAKLFRETCTQDAYLAYLDALSRHDVTDLLPRVSVPALVVTGPADDLFLEVDIARELAVSIPNAQLWLQTGGLEGQVERVSSFLAETLTAEADQSGVAPGGFQTILFTDLEASTPLTQRLGDEGAQGILRGHNTTVRTALDEHGGREVKHTGDGIMASFPSAVAAVTAALQIQRGLAGGEVRPRLGASLGCDQLASVHETPAQETVAPLHINAIAHQADAELARQNRRQIATEEVRMQGEDRRRLTLLRQRHDRLGVAIGGEIGQRRGAQANDAVGVSRHLVDESLRVGGTDDRHGLRVELSGRREQLQRVGVHAAGPVLHNAPHFATHSTFSFSRSNVTSSATTASGPPSSM